MFWKLNMPSDVEWARCIFALSPALCHFVAGEYSRAYWKWGTARRTKKLHL